MVIANCDSCGGNNIKSTICLINQKLMELGAISMNNARFGTKRDFPSELFKELRIYKDILENMNFQSDYTVFSSFDVITRVKKIVNVQY